MKFFFSSILFVLLISTPACYVKAQQPGVEEFKKVFEAQLQKLIPNGYKKRTVKFVSVIKGTPNSGYYPFKVVAYIHDYNAGYPPNAYYGTTCLSKMDGWKFDMRKDDFGEWIVQGSFTVINEVECKDNLSEGAQSISLDGVPGTVYDNTKKNDTKPPVSGNTKPEITSKLYIGQYACYGTRGALLTGMGFTLFDNGTYADLDGKRAGKYQYNATASTINFIGGFLGGQTGKNVKTTGFQISNTVNAEPWR